MNWLFSRDSRLMLSSLDCWLWNFYICCWWCCYFDVYCLDHEMSHVKTFCCLIVLSSISWVCGVLRVIWRLCLCMFKNDIIIYCFDSWMILVASFWFALIFVFKCFSFLACVLVDIVSLKHLAKNNCYKQIMFFCWCERWTGFSETRLT